MPARLKVFRTTLGFFEAVVAAPSQAAALKAWDVRENLFQHGAARVEDDPAAVEAALAQPGVVLRRPMSGTGGFQAEPDLPTAPEPQRPVPSAKGGKAAAPPPPKPKPDRSALDAAERALADADEEHARAEAALATERAALDARAARLQRDHDVRRRELEQALNAARRAFVRAGGEA